MAPDSKSFLQLVNAPDNLWYRLNVFVYDLRRFKDNNASQSRLEQVTDPMYIGLPYFSSAEADLIKNTIVDAKQSTLAAVLTAKTEAKLKKKLETKDFQICTGHDLAPIFEEAFGIDSKQLARNNAFQKLLTRSQLTLADNERFKGVGKNKLK